MTHFFPHHWFGQLKSVSIRRSACSTFLISCSTDNTAIVFDTNKDKKVKILAEHKGWVNGVAWDPSNQYIATIASDRSAIGVHKHNWERWVSVSLLVLKSSLI